MNTPTTAKEHTNSCLEDHFNRHLTNDYDQIAVLILYWKEADHPGFKNEAEQLEPFFRQQLHYPVVQLYEIPSSKSFWALDSEMNRSLEQMNAPRSLAIIHYGGHGDPDFEDSKTSRRRGVWAARTSEGPSLNWSDIQPKLGNAKGEGARYDWSHLQHRQISRKEHLLRKRR